MACVAAGTSTWITTSPRKRSFVGSIASETLYLSGRAVPGSLPEGRGGGAAPTSGPVAVLVGGARVTSLPVTQPAIAARKIAVQARGPISFEVRKVCEEGQGTIGARKVRAPLHGAVAAVLRV